MLVLMLGLFPLAAPGMPAPSGAVPASARDANTCGIQWATLMTCPSGLRTKNRRMPHGSLVSGCTIS
ncbi:hypothetical protein GCM10022286_05490 [Gryllotalpicola daejeonensis]|uniref:Uncharacterized protein n=1 Tax=Gryllotalpicola daejeonensis TaxID=993087 RepID=A0ABP7ZFA5_9MICO